MIKSKVATLPKPQPKVIPEPEIKINFRITDIPDEIRKHPINKMFKQFNKVVNLVWSPNVNNHL